MFVFASSPQVVIVGNGAVGKSSMIQKYCKGIFTTEYKKTIGVDFLEKRIWWDILPCPKKCHNFNDQREW